MVDLQPERRQLRLEQAARQNWRVFTLAELLALEFTRVAPVSNRAQLDRLITKSLEQSRMDHALMRTVLGRYQASRLPGVPLVTAAYAAYLPRASARSDLERRFDAALAGGRGFPRRRPT